MYLLSRALVYVVVWGYAGYFIYFFYHVCKNSIDYCTGVVTCGEACICVYGIVDLCVFGGGGGGAIYEGWGRGEGDGAILIITVIC